MFLMVIYLANEELSNLFLYAMLLDFSNPVPTVNTDGQEQNCNNTDTVNQISGSSPLRHLQPEPRPERTQPENVVNESQADALNSNDTDKGHGKTTNMELEPSAENTSATYLASNEIDEVPSSQNAVSHFRANSSLEDREGAVHPETTVIPRTPLDPAFRSDEDRPTAEEQDSMMSISSKDAEAQEETVGSDRSLLLADLSDSDDYEPPEPVSPVEASDLPTTAAAADSKLSPFPSIDGLKTISPPTMLPLTEKPQTLPTTDSQGLQEQQVCFHLITHF